MIRKPCYTEFTSITRTISAFLSFFNTEKTHGVEIFLRRRQRPMYPVYLVPDDLGSVSIRRLIVRSREVSKPRDWQFKLSHRFEIWQAHRQHGCRCACQISERSYHSKYKSRGWEALRDLTLKLDPGDRHKERHKQLSRCIGIVLTKYCGFTAGWVIRLRNL